MIEHPGRGESFPTTRWSVVRRAGGGDAADRREAVGAILTAYLPAMKAHLVHRKGFRPERADDLLQEFVADKVLQKDLIAQADAERGRFRTFLLTALNRFAINQVRDERALKRAPSGGTVAFEDHVEAATGNSDPSRVFDIAWARQAIAEALALMQAECAATGRHDLWEVFQGRVVAPILEGSEPVEYGELVRRFGFSSPGQATNALTTAKRMYVFMAIMIARVRLQTRISKLDDAALAVGLRWCLEQPWLDAGTRSLCEEGISVLTTE